MNVLYIQRLYSPVRLLLNQYYHTKLIDHYENPRNIGSIDSSNNNVGVGLVGSPACGDVMKLQIKVNDSGKIVDAKFKTFGCLAGNVIIATPNGYVKIQSLEVMEE